MQEALIGTFKNFKRFEHRGEWALQAYLRQAVMNRIRDELRRLGTRPRRDVLPAEIQASDQSPLQAAVGRELFEHYEAALGTLEPTEREAVIARSRTGLQLP